MNKIKILAIALFILMQERGVVRAQAAEMIRKTMVCIFEARQYFVP